MNRLTIAIPTFRRPQDLKRAVSGVLVQAGALVGGVGPVTAAQPWARQVLTRALSQPGEGISSSSMKTRASEPWAWLRARLRPATMPGSGS